MIMKNKIQSCLSDVDYSKKIEYLENRPPPYHIYECLGEFFVYDTSTKALYNIDKITYYFLKKCLEGKSISEVRDILISDCSAEKEEIDFIAAEVALLADNGLFDCPEYARNEEFIESWLNERYKNFKITSLTLAMTEACNLACIYCYCSDRQKVYNRKISNETIKRAIDWYVANSGDQKKLSLVFFGGEPLMNKSGIIFAINYSQKICEETGKEFSYHMTSNVTLVDNDTADFIKKYRISVLVSHDGPQYIHDKQCPMANGKGSFVQATAGAEKIIKINKNVEARATLTHLAPNIKELVSFYEALGFAHVFLGPAVNPEYSLKEYDFTEDDYISFYKQHESMLPNILKKLASSENVFYDPYVKNEYKFNLNDNTIGIDVTNCGAAGSGCLYVNVDGKIYPCHHFYGMGDWEIGDIDSPLSLDRLKLFWRKYYEAKKQCVSCWAGGVCTGPCAADLMTEHGTFSDNIRFCDSRRFNLERTGYYAYKKSFLNQPNNPKEKEK